VWLAIVIGWLAQLGLKVLVPTAVLAGIRWWSLASGNQALWLENPGDSSSPVWFVLQACVIAGSAVAGMLAGILSPRRSIAVPVTLVSLSLLATAFEQFPRPMSAMVGSIWTGGPCAGLVVGYALAKIAKISKRRDVSLLLHLIAWPPAELARYGVLHVSCSS
jgi:hypothetical protein